MQIEVPKSSYHSQMDPVTEPNLNQVAMEDRGRAKIFPG